MTLNAITTAAVTSAPASPLHGSAGNDTLNGGAADDVLDGLAGKDLLFGVGGNDTLDGGAGNDTLNGGLGNDTYLFGRGDGRDIVYMSDVRPMSEVNTLRLKDGVLPSDIALDMSGTSLLIDIAGGSDQFRVDGFFFGNNTTNSANPLQQIVFADGSAWNLADIQARLYAGTQGADRRDGTYLNDVIAGSDGNDWLDGKGGDDTIDGGADDDTLIGAVGDDRLMGGGGNDTLDGGRGNDTLQGGSGSDTYLFGRGDGADTITSGWDDGDGQADVLQFKPGIAPADITLATPDSGMVIKIDGGADQVLIEGFPNVPLQEIRFDDGTVWNRAKMESVLFAGSNGADDIKGSSMADTITGLAGNDHIYGNDGDDTLDGGAGDDRIIGGVGKDTYLFGKGDGQDTLLNNGFYNMPDKFGTLQFGAGIRGSDLQLSTSGMINLVIKIAGGNDQLTVHNFLTSWSPVVVNPLQQITFADGTSWDLARINAELEADSAPAPVPAAPMAAPGADVGLVGVAPAPGW